MRQSSGFAFATASFAFMRNCAFVSTPMFTMTASFSHAMASAAELEVACGKPMVKSSCMCVASVFAFTRRTSFSGL